MADELSEPVAHATTAHECNGDREGPACNNLSDSGASISDGATEIYNLLHVAYYRRYRYMFHIKEAIGKKR